MPNGDCDLSTTLSMYQLWCSDVALGRPRCNKAVNKAPSLLQKYCECLLTALRNTKGPHVVDLCVLHCAFFSVRSLVIQFSGVIAVWHLIHVLRT